MESVISPLLSPSSLLHHPVNRKRRQVRGAEHRRGPFQIELLSNSPASNRIDEIPPVRLLSPSKEFSMLAIVVYREWSKFLKKDSIVLECFSLYLFFFFEVMVARKVRWVRRVRSLVLMEWNFERARSSLDGKKEGIVYFHAYFCF